MSPLAKLVVKNMAGFRRELRAADKRRVKSAETSVKVEGFRLMQVLKKELRAGSPGGRASRPLRNITHGLRRRKSNPLARFAKAVRYHTSGTGSGLTVEVGFLTWRVPGARANTTKLSSKSSGTTWRKKADVTQRGTTLNADDYRQYFIRFGNSLGKRSKYRRFFFLKKTTKTLKIPARPMIDPFWARHKAEAAANIRRNFKLKMQGIRI